MRRFSRTAFLLLSYFGALGTRQTTPDALSALEPDALGVKILALLCKRGTNQNQGMFNLGNLVRRCRVRSPLSRRATARVDLAIGEAWSWLEREGSLIPASDTNGQNAG